MQLHHRFIETALKNLNQTAVIDISRNAQFSYKQILAGALLLSKQIKELTDEKHVGVMIPVSAGAIIAKLAVLMAGKTPAMINYSTGALQNCEYARKKCGIKFFITSSTLLKKLELNADDDMVMMEDIMASIGVFSKLIEVLTLKNARKRVHNGSDDENAVLLFTSGSEKDPKIVPLTHSNIGANYDSIRKALDLHDTDRYVSVLPYFHVFGMTTSLWTPLLIGGTLITHGNPLDFKAVVKSIVDHKATCLFSTPAFFHGYNLRARKGDFDSLRILVAGGDKLPKELYDSYRERHNIEILEGYGTTELSPVVSVNRIGNNKLGSIGLPLDQVEVKIVGIESGEELGFNQEGKLLVKGPNVMKGYLNDPEQTAKVLQDGWYDTGDIALIDPEGFIFHKGRYKRFIKVGGEMVSLVAVEEKVRTLIPDDCVCCAVAMKHPTKGAEVAIALDHALDIDRIKKELSSLLPPLMMPKHFVVLDSMPLLGSGKVNFRQVEEIVNK